MLLLGMGHLPYSLNLGMMQQGQFCLAHFAMQDKIMSCPKIDVEYRPSLDFLKVPSLGHL